jgi:Na+/H+ antiporter NhaC
MRWRALELPVAIGAGVLLDPWNARLLVFIIGVGVFTRFLMNTGAAAQFDRYCVKVNSPRRTQSLLLLLSIPLALDDYLNCLTRGAVMRPIADRTGVSREKLAYLLHSTALSASLAVPISSGAVFVLGLLREVDILGDRSAFGYYLELLPHIAFAWIALGLAAVVSVTGGDFGRMRQFDAAAGVKIPPTPAMNVSEREPKLPWIFLAPVSLLVIGTVTVFPLYGGLLRGISLHDALTASDITVALLAGMGVALLMSGTLLLRRSRWNWRLFWVEVGHGILSMREVVAIILLGWIFADFLVGEVKTPAYFLTLVQNVNPGPNLILPLLYVVALMTTFCIGCAWSSMSVIIGLFVPFVVSLSPHDTSMVAVAIGALLSGVIAGDLISPTSDLTVLSSATAEISIVRHLSSQRLYASIAILLCLLWYLL